MDIKDSSLEMLEEALGLSDIKIESFKLIKKEMIIHVNSTCGSVLCRLCGRPTSPYGSGRELTLRHLPIFGRSTYIKITPRRGICKYCDHGPTTTECLNWYDRNSKYTKLYEQHLLFELINSTVADVSLKEAVDYHSIESLLDKYIETEADFDTIASIGVLGIDEISLKKGYRDFVTIITYRDEEQVRLLAVLDGRRKSTIEGFFREIPRRLKKTIVAICCDLYDGYVQAAKSVFKGKIPIVSDRFHVAKLYRRCLVTLRKAELRRLRKKLSTDEYKKLKPAIALLKKGKDYFTDDERRILERLFLLSPKLKLAYQMSHKLTSIFNSDLTKQESQVKLMDWVAQVTASELTVFNKFIKTLENYIDEISNYFMGHHNSGFVEGFNNRIKVLKRRCYGLCHRVRLFQRMILDTLGFDRFAPGATYA